MVQKMIGVTMYIITRDKDKISTGYHNVMAITGHEEKSFILLYNDGTQETVETKYGTQISLIMKEQK